MKKLVLTVGNAMMGDDAAGPLLAQMLRGSPLEDWDALDGGSAPENLLHRIREISPDYVLIVDSADMDLDPGEIRRIEAEKIDDPFFITTHSLPLSYLIQSIEEFVPIVEMIGIQPDVVAFGYPLSPNVKQAVVSVYESLKQSTNKWDTL